MNAPDYRSDLLRPCPFCGSRPFIDGDDDETPPRGTAVTCVEESHGEVWIHGDTSDDAIAKWNRRAPLATLDDADKRLVVRIFGGLYGQLLDLLRKHGLDIGRVPTVKP